MSETKKSLKQLFIIAISYILAFVIGHITATKVVGSKAEIAIEELRSKHPSIFEGYRDHEFNGVEFTRCLKNQDVMHADNTLHCIKQSSYKP